MEGAGFCSLYQEIHYNEIHYNEIWVYAVRKRTRTELRCMDDLTHTVTCTLLGP